MPDHSIMWEFPDGTIYVWHPNDYWSVCTPPTASRPATCTIYNPNPDAPPYTPTPSRPPWNKPMPGDVDYVPPVKPGERPRAPITQPDFPGAKPPTTPEIRLSPSDPGIIGPERPAVPTPPPRNIKGIIDEIGGIGGALALPGQILDADEMLQDMAINCPALQRYVLRAIATCRQSAADLNNYYVKMLKLIDHAIMFCDLKKKGGRCAERAKQTLNQIEYAQEVMHLAVDQLDALSEAVTQVDCRGPNARNRDRIGNSLDQVDAVRQMKYLIGKINTVCNRVTVFGKGIKDDRDYVMAFIDFCCPRMKGRALPALPGPPSIDKFRPRQPWEPDINGDGIVARPANPKTPGAIGNYAYADIRGHSSGLQHLPSSIVRGVNAPGYPLVANATTATAVPVDATADYIVVPAPGGTVTLMPTNPKVQYLPGMGR
jgi:hypothetical protein